LYWPKTFTVPAVLPGMTTNDASHVERRLGSVEGAATTVGAL
jgi:hypothetical protein